MPPVNQSALKLIFILILPLSSFTREKKSPSIKVTVALKYLGIFKSVIIFIFVHKVVLRSISPIVYEDNEFSE